MTDNEIFATFDPLWSDIQHEKNYPKLRPLLAHYTSIANLEAVMRSEELWFSNPLFMNDTEEVRFGMHEGSKAFHNSQEIKAACGSAARYQVLVDLFNRFYRTYENDHVFDTYVFSLSVHDLKDTDGMLSMWRGYGGNGHGVAIVFDSEQIQYKETGSPLIISKVEYMNPDARRAWIGGKMKEFSELLTKTSVPDHQLAFPVAQLFERIKIAALFTKHEGFKEEAEWRVAYLKERDPSGVFSSMMSYGLGRNGVEPKLKFKIKPIDGYTAPDISLDKLVNRIVLGPMMSGALARQSVCRMLETINKGSMVDRVCVSSIPYRPS